MIKLIILSLFLLIMLGCTGNTKISNNRILDYNYSYKTPNILPAVIYDTIYSADFNNIIIIPADGTDLTIQIKSYDKNSYFGYPNGIGICFFYPKQIFMSSHFEEIKLPVFVKNTEKFTCYKINDYVHNFSLITPNFYLNYFDPNLHSNLFSFIIFDINYPDHNNEFLEKKYNISVDQSRVSIIMKNSYD